MEKLNIESIKPLTVEETISKAIGFFQMADYPNSIDCLTDILSKNNILEKKDLSYLQYLLGYSYQKNNNNSKAVEYYNKAILNNLNNYNAYLNRGVIYISLQKFDAAEKDFLKALDYKNSRSSALANLISMALQKRNLTRAQMLIEIADFYNLKSKELNYNKICYFSLIDDVSKCKELFSPYFKENTQDAVSILADTDLNNFFNKNKDVKRTVKNNT